MTAGVVCGSCGTRLREAARFCDACGAPAVAPPATAEYKQVTALFADVVRSMDLAAALDAERYRQIMTALVDMSVATVHRYGGGTVDYTGDGVMAIFGAPRALEDHAFRACLAALAIQQDTGRLAAELARDDGVDLRVRVGLNSGQVIAGEIGSRALGYRATGHAVGLAQRMESAAPPGAVLLSETTARLVERAVVLGEPEWVRIKGSEEPVPARRLLAIRPREEVIGHAETRLVGRRWETAALDAMLDRAVGRRGGVVNVVGPPGIGKSRVAREAAAAATARGVEVFWGFCESHARDVPFHVVTRLLRAHGGVTDLDGEAARARVRDRFPAADAEDLLLLHDLLGIADPQGTQPQIDPDARRRRLTALINAASLARTEPALLIVEDAHWIDAASESMLADFLTVIPHTTSMVLITSRPEYQGALTRALGAHTIALAPLGDSDVATLLDEFLGTDLSVRELAAAIVQRAAGNPFFAEEMVRELIQRGVLTGARGRHVCRVDVAELSIPANVQAAVEARVDLLSAPAKRTLTAASVIGARFGAELLAALGIRPVVDELLDAELIDQVRFTPTAEYAFRHPLIRAVAYESQLKADRAQWHRRLAAVIESGDPDAADQNAALIAEHLESAGELHAGYAWHMRAGAWLTNRDVAGARVSWTRAAAIADRLPDAPEKLAMRIAPRTMLCATGWLANVVRESWDSFAELQGLCTEAGDKVSVAVGMTGLTTKLLYAGRPGEGSRLASEQMALLDSIGDPALTVGLSFVAFANWFNSGDFAELLRWSQTVIDLAAGDSAMGSDFGIGSPLAIALTFRGVARWWLGRPGWRDDLDDGVAMARNSDPNSYALAVAWNHLALVYGVLRADDAALRNAEETARIASVRSNDFAVLGAQFTLGVTLLYRDQPADRNSGLALIVRARDEFLTDRAPSLVPVARVCAARENAKRGDHDAAIPEIRAGVAELDRGRRLGWLVCSTGLLVETLLERGTDADIAEARELIDRLTNLVPDERWAILGITLLRLRALLSRAAGDDDAERELLRRYHATAQSLGFEGHIAWAEAMQAGLQ